MTQPRSTIVSIDDTPWYHCVCRCVRRAFLCGDDHFSGKNFDHRREWIADRIGVLSSVFAIDIASYAVMSNHYHIVMRVDRERALAWSVDEVLRRWTCLFKGAVLIAKYLSDERASMSQAELDVVLELAEVYRARLFDLSWYMRMLNESVARMANAEDGVKGRFWEGRFKSQALLDEQAILTAMAYVDLNPIRAGIAETPESSDFTSIQKRMGAVSETVELSIAKEEQPKQSVTLPAKEKTVSGGHSGQSPGVENLPPASLMPFDATGRTIWAIPFAFKDYLELVDWTGRAVHPLKRGFIPDDQPVILKRLGINAEQFVAHADHFLKNFGTAVGIPKNMVDLCARHQHKFLKGMSFSQRLFDIQQEAA